VEITSRLGSPETTALVEPRAFTTGLMDAAQAHGAVLRYGTVVDLLRSPNGAVRGVALAGGEVVEGDAVVILHPNGRSHDGHASDSDQSALHDLPPFEEQHAEKCW